MHAFSYILYVFIYRINHQLKTQDPSIDQMSRVSVPDERESCRKPRRGLAVRVLWQPKNRSVWWLGHPSEKY